jgi:hypothetical protein
MRIVDELTGSFRAHTLVALEKAQAARGANAAEIASLTARHDELLDAAADPDGAGLTAEVNAELDQIDARLRRLTTLAPRLDANLRDAQRAEDERIHAKELAAQREAARTRVRSFTQHASEFSRQLNRVPDLLAQLHKALEEGAAAADRAELVSGTSGSLHTAKLLDHALKAAGLETWLQDAQAATAYDRSEVRPLNVEVDEQVSSATDNFEYSLGLKDRPIREPTDAELFAQAEAERQQRETDERVRKLAEGDRQEWARHFPPPGKAEVLPYTEHLVAAQMEQQGQHREAAELRAIAAGRAADAEARGDTATADAIRRGNEPLNGPPLNPAYVEAMEKAARPSSGSRIDPFTGRG